MVGDACSIALVDALKAWRLEHTRSAGYESLIGEHIKQVECTVTVKETGKCSMHVAVTAKKAHKSDTYYYQAAMAAGEISVEKITD